MFRTLAAAVVLISSLSFCVYSQTPTSKLPNDPPQIPKSSDPPPGGMTLLPGYTHTKKRGIDTAVGEISEPGGLTIRYDNGFLAGNVAWRMNGELPGRNVKVIWYQEQLVNGLHLYLIKGEDHSIYATFPETCSNFMAFDVNEQQLVDFLLMITTYHEKPRKEVRTVNGRPTC